MVFVLIAAILGIGGAACADDVGDVPVEGVGVVDAPGAAGWQELAELVESLPDDLDDETRQLIVDLLAESGGFAAAPEGLPDNELEPEPPPFVTLSVLSRAEGVLEGPSGSESAAGSGAGEFGARGWRSFDARAFLRVRGDVAGGVTFGGAVERDPGEEETLDHVGGYLRWDVGDAADDDGSVRVAIVAGDVVAEWGQHLIAGAPAFGTSKGPVLSDRLRGYDGAAEAVGRRGAAASVRIGAFAAVVLASRTLLDASLDDDGRVTAIRTSGTHVTEGERLGRDALCESVLGLRLVRAFGRSSASGRASSDGKRADGACRLGVSALRVRYDRMFTPADPVRNRFGFEGDALELCGVDVSGSVSDLRWGAEVAAHHPGEHAAVLTMEARRGHARVLLGADLVSRGFGSPLGTSPPGASSGGNCVASWLGLSYSARGAWSAWCRGRATGHPWRTYNDPLPPHTVSLAAGGSARLGSTARLTAEVSVRGETGTSVEPYTTESTTDRRERFSLGAGRVRRWKLWFARSARTRDGAGCGRRTGAGCSLTSVLNRRGDRLDVGVMLVSGEGSAPTLYAGEPGLPGAFGLRSLKGSGAGWYIRARKALPAGTLVTVRVSRSASGEELTLGLAIEAGTTSRR